MSIEQSPVIAARQQDLEHHGVFAAIRNLDDLRQFMSWHVFAVWDFMCLVKRLQGELTSTGPLWLPPEEPLAARLINDIVLAEESDEVPGGEHLSHFEIYLLAMEEVGADTAQINNFIELLRSGVSARTALEKAGVDPSVCDFVTGTLDTAENGSLYQVLGSFFFGREHVIPTMFSSLLERWSVDANDAPMFVYYLNRHIELDGDSHGPAAIKIIRSVTQGDQDALAQINTAAIQAIESRIALWDALQQSLQCGETGRVSGAS